MIQGRKKGERLCFIDRQWCLVHERTKLGDVRIHDCRHTFASRALALGEALPVIGKLLGHSDIETPARYAHLVRIPTHLTVVLATFDRPGVCGVPSLTALAGSSSVVRFAGLALDQPDASVSEPFSCCNALAGAAAT